MYLEHFKIKEMPYKITPDPRFLYMTPQHQEALEKCRYVIDSRGGLVVIYGAIGMGKTTVARKLADDLRSEPNYLVAALTTPALKTDNALLREIMDEFDLPAKRSYALSLKAFREFILEAHGQGKNMVVIIDEAQKLSHRMLDVLHTLHNFESNTDKFLQMVLIGQQELATNIDAFPEIKSRVAVFGELQNLNLDDTRDMIAFRWRSAGGKDSDPFTEEAIKAIYLASRGLPREICKLCHESLIRAFAAEEQKVTEEMVIDAIKALRLTIRKED